MFSSDGRHNPLIARAQASFNASSEAVDSTASSSRAPQNHGDMDRLDRMGDSGAEDSESEDAPTPAGGGAGAQAATNGGGAAGTANESDMKYKRKIACMACRTIKLRCLLASPTSAPDDPCHRCTRMSISCVYKRKRKPLRPGQVRREEGEEVPGGGEIVRVDGKGKAKSSSVSNSLQGLSGRDKKEVEEVAELLGARRPDYHSNGISSRTFPPQSHSRTNSFDKASFFTTDPATLSSGSSRPYLSSMAKVDDDSFPRPPLITGSHTGGQSSTFPYGMTSLSNDRAMSNDRQYGPGQSNFTFLPPDSHRFDGGGPRDDSMYRNQAYFPPPDHEMDVSPKYRTSMDSGPGNSMFGSFSSATAQANSNMHHQFNLAESLSPAASRPSNATSTPGGALGATSISSSHSAPRPRTIARMSTEGQIQHAQEEDVNVQDRVRERTIRERERPERHSMTLSSVLDNMRRDLSPFPPGERRRRSHSGGRDDGDKDPDRLHKLKRMRWDDAGLSGRGPYGPDTSWERSRMHGLGDADSAPISRDGRGGMESRDEVTVGEKGSLENVADDSDWNPVKLGLLKADDVPYLWNCFFSKLNHYIALLDPALHTREYVSRTCPALFVSLLTVTARSYQPDRYPALLKLANQMLGQAFARGQAEIGLIQSLSLLSAWKDGTDKSNWMKMSYAISIAFMLSLDAAPRRPLPEDEMEAREILNRERTWIQIFSTDRTLHMMFGRPRMCSAETQWSIARWVKDHPQFPCYADAMLAASQGSGGLLSGMRQHRTFEPDGVRFKMTLHQFKVDFAQWDATWFGEETPAPVHPTSMVILRYYALLCDFEFAEFQRLLTPANPSFNMGEAIVESVVRAVDLLKYIVDILAPAEIMAYAPDVITIGAAKAGVFLVRHAAQIEPSVNDEIAQIFRQLVQICRTASHGEDMAHYQAKFFSSLKRVGSVAPTRAASRFGSPKLGAAKTGPTGLSNGVNSQGDIITGDALTARLKDVAADGHIGTGGGNELLNGTTPSLGLDTGNIMGGTTFTLEDLLMESADWFSLDVVSQLNDTAWGGGMGMPTVQQQQMAAMNGLGWPGQQAGDYF